MSQCRAFACATKGCQATIHLHHDIEARLRRTHESFYCPAGHENYFPGKTDEEKKVEQIERSRDRFREMWHEALDRVEDFKIDVRTCPFECGYRVKRKQLPESIRWALQLHLMEEHGAQMPEPVVEEAASA